MSEHFDHAWIPENNNDAISNRAFSLSIYLFHNPNYHIFKSIFISRCQKTLWGQIQIYQKVLTFKYSNSTLCYKCQLWCRANRICQVFLLYFTHCCILLCIVLDPIRTCAVFPPNIYKHTRNTKLLADLHLISQNHKHLIKIWIKYFCSVLPNVLYHTYWGMQ